MSILNSYLSQGKVKQVLARRPGEAGFSLIELVVVVAVLAILAAIAIPSFTSINTKARAAAAMNVVATTAKQCAVKFANNETGNDLKIAEVSLNGYDSFTINGETDECDDEGEIVATAADQDKLPTFRYDIETGDKTCSYAGDENDVVGCSNDGLW